MIISVLVRRLQEGLEYPDFRAAWMPDKGFGVPTRVVSGVSLDNPREIVTVGFSEIDPAEVPDFLARVGPQEQLRAERIREVTVPGGSRGFYLQVADDDLSDGPPASG
ncbi:MAG TPA: hypothetical protein VMT37_15540 [Solirubrobacterales bacterium]|nr:hypothetical protein [Solirubrobacterales bacterium]